MKLVKRNRTRPVRPVRYPSCVTALPGSDSTSLHGPACAYMRLRPVQCRRHSVCPGVVEWESNVFFKIMYHISALYHTCHLYVSHAPCVLSCSTVILNRSYICPPYLSQVPCRICKSTVHGPGPFRESRKQHNMTYSTIGLNEIFIPEKNRLVTYDRHRCNL